MVLLMTIPAYSLLSLSPPSLAASSSGAASPFFDASAVPSPSPSSGAAEGGGPPDATITIAGQSGLFQLNVMLPVVALNLLQSLEILSSVSNVLADKAISGFTVREDNIQKALERNPILVTALNPVIGYELGAATAKKAYKKGKPIKEVALKMTDLTAEELDRLLDPLDLTRGGIKE